MNLLTYGWIALGGALGSVGRAWLALAVARLTGPQFPWGTILINVLGSFVIGFFGAMTGAEGRFSVHADARAFVMIGICGGFTTFSSFSLQTLDLARDGRPGQAFANIALSVALCLASVAVGHFGVVALSPGRVVGEAAEPAPAVLALLDESTGAAEVLTAAARLAALGGGRVAALAIRTPPGSGWLPGEEVLTAERKAELASGEARRTELVQTAFQTWRQRVDPGADGTWTEVIGHPASVVAEHGSAAAFIVLRRPGPDRPLVREALHAALFDTAAPVLLIPPTPTADFGRIVAIAWREDPRASGAVRAALPLLRRADRVIVLCAEEAPGQGSGIPRSLEESGIRAGLVQLPYAGTPVAPVLLAAACEEGADLLVMGAFAHGEWREALLGGVTRHVLAQASLPVLMRH